jgi:phosphate starvation-inducible protein PhoH and related proteins
MQVTFPDADNHRLANLCGVLDENLRQIETALERQHRPARRGVQRHRARTSGRTGRLLLKDFYQRARKPLDIDDIQLALVEVAHKPAQADAESDMPVLMTRRTGLHGRTAAPEPVHPPDAGTRHHLRHRPGRHRQDLSGGGRRGRCLERDLVKRIVLVRPAVEAGERLGFLPGDLVQKVDPYLRPLYDALYDLMGFDKATRLFERDHRDRAAGLHARPHLNHAFIILDEAQNTTPEQMKMFLTRIGFGSQAVVTGDVTQIDLQRAARRAA